jgi:hypothetical protein
MSNAIAAVTEGGFGKTTSLGKIPEYNIEGVNPKETLLINIKGKPLSFRGWRKLYTPILQTEPPLTANYLSTTDPALIIKTIQYFDANRKDIKNVIVDDFQYLMSEEFMTNALKSGYDKYNKMAKNAYDVINAGLNMRPDVNFVILTHAEETKEGSYKMKTIGKMLDEKVTLQGLFTIVLYGKSSYDATSKAVKKEYVTNFDGEYPAKSPVGMFKDIYIPNDMGYVLKTVNEYYNGE